MDILRYYREDLCGSKKRGRQPVSQEDEMDDEYGVGNNVDKHDDGKDQNRDAD